MGHRSAIEIEDMPMPEATLPILKGPYRAHSLIVSIGADTAKDLAWELRNMAANIERGEMTVGTMGGGSVGSTYSYRIRPEQTHDRYFQEIDAWLEAEKSKTIV